MITLLSTLLGIFGSILPKGLEYFQDRADKKHELELAKLQIQAIKDGHVQKLEELSLAGETEMRVASYEFAKRQKTGVKWVDAFLEFYSGTVRPTITYAVFGLYAFCKIAMMTIALRDLPWTLATVSIWTETDEILLSIVIGFWFGGRAISQFSRGK